MNWIQAIASPIAIILAAIGGGNFSGMNQPGSPAGLWQYILFVGLPFMGAAGASGAVLLWQRQPPAGVVKPHLRAVGREIGDAAAREDLDTAQRLLDALKPAVTR